MAAIEKVRVSPVDPQAELRRLTRLRDEVLAQLRQIEKDIAQYQNGNTVLYVDAQEAEAASARIFEENAELFKKLAQ